MEQRAVIESLGESGFFRLVPETERAAIADRMRRVRFEAEQVVFSRGDPARDVYLVLEGRVRLSILSSDGNFISIDISSTGLSAADFVAAALAEGVLIRSLETHHANRRFVRVTVGTRAENARCVRALERVLSRRGSVRVARLSAASSDAE